MDDSAIRGKKVLLLGGIGPTADLFELAHRNGVKVGVADYNKNTRIKLLADFQHDVDATNIEEIVKIYQEKHYDGIISNFNDMLSPYVAKVAKIVGAYSPFTEEQLKMSTDKKHFKETCLSYGIPVPKEYHLDTENDIKDIINYPVIIKPVDGSGSKGISICKNKEELIKGYQKAKSQSRSGNIIVEDYIPYDEINITYIAQDGNIQLAAIHDRYFNETQKNVVKVPDMYIYPSRYTNMYIKKYNQRVINMLQGIGVKNGSLFIQAMVRGEEVYLYEAGMRLNGCKTYQILEVENDYNTFEHLLNYSITGNMGKQCVFTPNMSRWYATWNVVGVPGMICQSFEGVSDLESYPWLIRNAQTYGPGEQIPVSAKGTLIQLVSRIHVFGNTKDQLLDHIDRMQKMYVVKDPNGSNVLMNPHSIEDLRRKINYDLH